MRRDFMALGLYAVVLCAACGARSGLEGLAFEVAGGSHTSGATSLPIGGSSGSSGVGGALNAGGSLGASANGASGGAAGHAGSAGSVQPLMCSTAPVLDSTAFDIDVGATLGASAVGDWNGDTRLDLAFVGADDEHVHVLLGHGDGTFAPELEGPVLDGARFLIAGDVDADGRLDLVTVSSQDARVRLLLGNGDGTFAPRIDLETGVYPDGVVIGDFNHDGRPDLASSDLGPYGGGSVSVLLGKGGGSFAPRVEYPLRSPLSIAAGDLNHDGNLDLVVGKHDAVVLLGKGDGTFVAGATYTTHDGVVGVALRDFDNDGNLDLGAGAECPPDGGAKGSVLLGRGDGSFGSAIQSTGWSSCDLPGIDDLNADGRLDLIEWTLVSFGKGDGTFVSGPSLPYAGVLGDWNGDGKPDLAAFVKHWLYVFPGNGDGTFGATHSFSAPRGGPIQLQDLNGDGKLDIALPTYDPAIGVLLGTGSGSFGTVIEYPTLPHAGELSAADLNDDGQLDLVSNSTWFDFQAAPMLSVFVGDGRGAYPVRVDQQIGAPGSAFGAPGLHSALGDLNGDRKPDLITAQTGWDTATSLSTRVRVWLGAGDGTFSAKGERTLASRVTALALGDLNGDGMLDLAASVESTTQEEDLSILVNAGDGTFARELDSVLGVRGAQLALGDLNNDQILDLVASNDETLSVSLGIGDGTFAPKRVSDSAGANA
ncbi:MAG TPA: VCBS repeat-containing protein, partial [Polyangiaceae bacterium]|nr:VCBS repeat-containing protein [Polyangiaceae bacterium]